MKILKYQNNLIKYGGLLKFNASTDPPIDPEPTGGYWKHKDTGAITTISLTDANISGTTYNTPSYLSNASEIVLPEGITSIGANAFSGSSNLQMVSVSSTVTNIGNNAFNNNTNLIDIRFYPINPPTFGSFNFTSNFRLQIRVPSQSFDTYRTSLSSYYYKLFVLNNLIPGSRVHSGYTNRTTIMSRNDSNIIIEGIHFNFSGVNSRALEIWQNSNVIVRNCKFSNVGKHPAVYILEASNVTIYNCEFENVHAAIRVSSCTGGLRIFNCDFKNIRGQLDGAAELGQAIQFINCNGSNNTISDNVIENIEGQSSPEDNINMFYSNFDENSPMIIRRNWIRGGGPSLSSGGIIIGDNGGGAEGSNQICEDNILVNPGQYGVAIAGGSNMVLQRNLVYGERKDWTNVGLIGVNWDDNYTSTNITIRENRVYWVHRDDYLNSYWIYSNIEPVIGKNTNIWDDTTLSANILPNQIIGV